MLKKSMDIIDTYAWYTTSSSVLSECFIDSAYRYKYAWLLKLRCRGSTRLLKVEPGQRIHFSNVEPREKEVDKFSQYIRAHIRGGRITGSSMPWWERIVVFETMRGVKKLKNYVELIPRGLWVITSVDDKILYASKFEEFRDRSIKPGLVYKPPPPRGIPPQDETGLLQSITQGKDLVRAMVFNWGLPGYVAEEILLRAGLYESKSKKPVEIEKMDLERIIQEYVNLLKESSTGLGYLVYSSQTLETYSPYKPRLFMEVYDWSIKETSSLEEALDIYYAEFEVLEESLDRVRRAERELEAWKKRIAEQEKLVEGYRRELEDLSRNLSLIYENYSGLENIVECARKVRAEKGWGFVVECGVRSYDEKNGIIVVEVSGVQLRFSVREEFAKQVLELEKRRGELEKKLSRALSILEELKAKSFELERDLLVKVYTRPSPKYWYEKYRWTITRNGFIVVAGRDASQNEAIVKKYLESNFYFLHADIHGAPATVLIKRGGEPAWEDLEDAATIAGCYSKAWKAGFSFVDVYWVYGSQVSKTPPSGEYLGKGAFMVYGERRYIRVPLRLGIGLRLFCDTIYGDYVKVFTGKPDLVKEKSLSYVVIVPGDLEPYKVAGKIAEILSELATRKTGVRFTVKVEEALDVVPGPSRIVEYGVGEGETTCKESGYQEESST